MLDCEPAYTQSCQKTCRRCLHAKYFAEYVRLPLHAGELGRETVKPSGLPFRSNTSKTAQKPIAMTTLSGIARCDSSRGTARWTS
eukprot:scaffold22820_cov61-Phaeocystis_antarctica.AAC.8